MPSLFRRRQKAEEKREEKTDEEGKDGGDSLQDIVQGIARLVTGKQFRNEMFQFMEDNEDVFQMEDAAEQKRKTEEVEHKLEHTHVYNSFCAKFEDTVQRFVESKGFTVSEVCSLLQEKSEARDIGGDGLVLALLTVFEFETFSEVMRDVDRRKYLKSITEAWAARLEG